MTVIQKAQRSTDIGWAVAAGCIDLFVCFWLFVLGLDGIWQIEGYNGGMQDPNAAAYPGEVLRVLAFLGVYLALPLAAFRCARALTTHGAVIGLAVMFFSQLQTVGG
ncbi:hypothetical protein [Streptomyces sp. NPDC059009]|uniref:hypothetical protein n=1 Tax=Streptomyces sp. NPDC059009 TaxID=3346694 RepID=UPI0036773216